MSKATVFAARPSGEASARRKTQTGIKVSHTYRSTRNKRERSARTRRSARTEVWEVGTAVPGGWGGWPASSGRGTPIGGGDQSVCCVRSAEATIANPPGNQSPCSACRAATIRTASVNERPCCGRDGAQVRSFTVAVRIQPVPGLPAPSDTYARNEVGHPPTQICARPRGSAPAHTVADDTR